MAVRFVACALSAATLTLSGLALAQEGAQFLDAPVLVVPDNQQRMNALLDLDGDGWTDAVGTFWKAEDEVAVFGFHNDGTGRLVPVFEHSWLQYGDNDMPFPIAVADLNGDGKDDFVACVRGDVEVFTSNGAAPPTLVSDSYTGSGHEVQALALGDYDNDGQIDAAVRMKKITTGADMGIRIYTSLLAAAPTSSYNLVPPAGTGFHMRNADADGDGVVDLVCSGGSRVDFFSVRNGDLKPAGSLSHGLTQDPHAVPGDVDGDGDDDVVVFGMEGKYCIMRRAGPTQYVVEPIQVGGPATDLADYDKDGDLDGVCCGGGGGYDDLYNNGLSWFEIANNDGTGDFAESFRLPSMGANHIAGVDDLDKDGDNDLIAGRVVYYNKGGIGPIQERSGTPYVEQHELQDIDGDGDPDVEPRFDTFHKNLGDGTLVATSRITGTPPAGTSYDGVGYNADYDGDGDLDVIVKWMQGETYLGQRMLRNTGSGGLVDAGPASLPGFQYSATHNPIDVMFGDVNGDGRLDIVSRDRFGEHTWIYTQDSEGLFTIAMHQQGIVAQEVADFDQDGHADVVVRTHTELKILFGDASVSMAAELSIFGDTGMSYVSNNGLPVTAADLDGDGDQDLVAPFPTGNSFVYTAYLIENVGARQFVNHADRFDGYQGAMLPTHVEDVNGDGHVDVLLGQRTEPGVALLIQGMSVYLGSAAPGPDFAYQGEQWPILWSMGDLDGDGDPDGYGYQTAYFNSTVDSPSESFRLQYGDATPGAGGHEPVFGAVGPFFGAAPIELRITGAAPNSAGILLVGIGDGSAPIGGLGGSLNVIPVVVTVGVFFPSATGEPGSGKLTLPIVTPAATVGFPFYHQVITVDPEAQGGAAVSNALELFYGQ